MKLGLLVAALLYLGALHAQHRAGDLLVDATSALRLDDPYDDLVYKVGFMATDRLLLGLTLHADNDRLFNTYNGSEVRAGLFSRLYLSRSRRFNPYLELGIGTLTDQGIFLALRPALGAELGLFPGVFGRIAAGYGRTPRGDAFTLEVGSTVSLSGWSNKARIPELLRSGEVVINSHLASLSLVDSEDYSDGLYGTARLEADLAVGSRLLFGIDLRYARSTSPRYPFLRPEDIASLSAGTELKFRFLRISNFIDPYIGMGALYARTEQRASPDFYTDLPVQTEDAFRPYATGGIYFHLTERIVLNLAVEQYRKTFSALKDRRRIEVGLALRMFAPASAPLPLRDGTR